MNVCKVEKIELFLKYVNEGSEVLTIGMLC